MSTIADVEALKILESGRRPIYELEDRGFYIAAFYQGENHLARVIVLKDGELFRDFEYTAYKVYNLAAHFSDIIDNELAISCPPHAARQERK